MSCSATCHALFSGVKRAPFGLPLLFTRQMAHQTARQMAHISDYQCGL